MDLEEAANSRDYRSFALYVLLVVVLAMLAWWGNTVSASISQLQKGQVEIATTQKNRTRDFESITKVLDRLSNDTADLNRRITRREDNSFTSRDGSSLSTKLAELSTTVSTIARDAATNQRQIAAVREWLRRILAEIKITVDEPGD